MPLPRPLLAPVTTATFPAKLAITVRHLPSSPFDRASHELMRVILYARGSGVIRMCWVPPHSQGVTAFLVGATDTERTKVVAAKRKPLISARSSWLVLIPDQQVPLLGQTTTGSYTAAMAVLVDARTGRRLEADALNS